MRRTSHCIAQAEVDARLAKVRRQQLPMTIGEVQQMHVAKRRHIVDVRGASRRGATAGHGEARRGCRGENLKKFAAIHVDLRLPEIKDAESPLGGFSNFPVWVCLRGDGAS